VNCPSAVPVHECMASALFMCSFTGTTPAAKTRSFCLLLVLHTAQVLSRTIMVALLVVTQGWFAAVYLGSDLLVFLIAKAARRDILPWLPNAGIRLSLLFRFGQKVFGDSTGCVDLRHPHDLGGRGSGETATEEAEFQAAIQRSMAAQTHRRQPAAEARSLTQWVLRVHVCFVRPLNPFCRHLHPSAVSTLR